MNQPITAEELARVAELDAKWCREDCSLSDSWNIESELATLCPRIARELSDARAKLETAREAFEAEELHQWAVRNLEAISDPLDERLLGLRMERERAAHEANTLRKSAINATQT